MFSIRILPSPAKTRVFFFPNFVSRKVKLFMRTRVGLNHQPQDPESCTLSIELQALSLSIISSSGETRRRVQDLNLWRTCVLEFSKLVQLTAMRTLHKLCAPEWSRTTNRWNRNPVLYPLSYGCIAFLHMGEMDKVSLAIKLQVYEIRPIF